MENLENNIEAAETEVERLRRNLQNELDVERQRQISAQLQEAQAAAFAARKAWRAARQAA